MKLRPLIALVLAAISVPLFGVAPPPVAGVVFTIESPTIEGAPETKTTPATKPKMKAEERDELERNVGALITEFMEQHFTFLPWRQSIAADARLLLHVTLEEEAVTPTNSTYVIRYAARVDQAKATLTGNDEPLYHFTDPNKRLRNGPKLEQDIRIYVNEQFGRDGFRQRLHEQLLRGLPLTTKPVMVNSKDKRIIVPVVFAALKADASSVLKVEFLRYGGKSHDYMNLTSLVARREAPEAGGVEAAISFCNAPPLFLKGEGLLWDSRLAPMLTPPTLVECIVTMEIYKQRPFTNASGRTATKPDAPRHH